VTDTDEGILDLATTDIGVKQAQGTDTAEGSVVSTHPDTGSFNAAQSCRGNMSDIRKAVEAIGLNGREETLVLTAGKSSPWDAHDRTDIAEVAAEHSRERFERSVGQTMTNSFDKVLALRKCAQYFPAAQQFSDSRFSDLCHLAVTIPPNGRKRNGRLTYRRSAAAASKTEEAQREAESENESDGRAG
jgi:hypothetical protein